MEKSFPKVGKNQINDQRNFSIVEIVMYVTAMIMLFGYWGRIADFSVMMIPFGGTLIFVPGSLFLIQASRIYWKDGNPF